MDTFLTKVANFSEIAVWVTGVLFVLEFVAIFIYAYRTGMVDEEAGRVVTEQARLSGSPLRGSRLIAGRYWLIRKVLVSRSGYISEMSLVDGTATKAKRVISRAIQLAFLLFWLAFLFGILALLPSEPGLALTLLFMWFWALYCGVTMIRRSRANALRRLAEKQARRAQ